MIPFTCDLPADRETEKDAENGDSQAHPDTEDIQKGKNSRRPAGFRSKESVHLSTDVRQKAATFALQRSSRTDRGTAPAIQSGFGISTIPFDPSKDSGL